MFGAKKFVFYELSSTPELKTCLYKYQQLGIVDVLPWPMPKSLLRLGHKVGSGSVLASSIFRVLGKAASFDYFTSRLIDASNRL